MDVALESSSSRSVAQETASKSDTHKVIDLYALEETAPNTIGTAIYKAKRIYFVNKP